MFDPAPAVAALTAIDRSLDLDARLVEVVEVMQRHVERIVGVMSVLMHAGAPGPMRHRPEGDAPTEVELVIADLIGPDASALRKPVDEVVALLRVLTLSSVHPLMATGRLDAAEIVDLVLDGTRRTPAHQKGR